MSIGVGFAFEVGDQVAGMGPVGGWGPPPRTSTLFWAASGVTPSSNVPAHTNTVRSFLIGLSCLIGPIRITRESESPHRLDRDESAQKWLHQALGFGAWPLFPCQTRIDGRARRRARPVPPQSWVAARAGSRRTPAITEACGPLGSVRPRPGLG